MRGIFTTSPSIIVWKVYRILVLILCHFVKSTLSWSIQASSWTWWASSWTPMSWLQLWRTSTKTSKSRSRMVMMITCEKWSKMMNWSLWVLSKCYRFHHRSGQLEFDEFVTLSARCSLKERKNKTQCRLCKRLAGPIILLSNLGTPLVWSDLVQSGVVWQLALITWMQSPTICLYT